jgi:hypothetical protein
MSTTPSPDPARFFNAVRPPRTEPTYPPEPQEALPKIGGPSPFRAAERQPPRIVLTADEAAERMKRLKDGEPSGDPVLKMQIVELQAKVDALETLLGQHVTGIQTCLEGIYDVCKTQKAELSALQKRCNEITDRLTPPSAAAATAPPAKKIAAKKAKKP